MTIAHQYNVTVEEWRITILYSVQSVRTQFYIAIQW